jgi:hypothetical protein
MTIHKITDYGQIKVGDVLLLDDGKHVFPATCKRVVDFGSHTEEIVFSLSKNYYFIMSKYLSGDSWIKSASKIERGRMYSFSNNMNKL